MRKYLLTTCVGALAVFAAGGANANDELIKMSQNPQDWVMPTGDYFNQRYSQLKQITEGHIGKLQVSWTISTSLQSGPESAPLVIGHHQSLQVPFTNLLFGVRILHEDILQ